MQILLDTHVLLWWLADDACLSKQARDVIADGNTIIFVSAATTWEIAIKKSIGKLKAPNNLPKVLEENHFEILPISILHTQVLEKLPLLHTDPFDRMLIAQAKHEGLTLLTHDKKLKAYKTPILLV